MKKLLGRALIMLPFAALTIGASPTAGPAREQVKPVFQQVLPNVPGKSMVAVVVSYPPGAKSASHRHAPSAFIYAHVLSGAVRSRVDDQPVKVYATGEGFYEPPGAHHWVSENASDTAPASLLAVFVVDTNDKVLTTADAAGGSEP